ncbi:efflux RND transporter periplasmic adaptor subunit [Pedobacter ghigonis]|uniref:efflux RND transporter periplasmic adaptor subunit n=1 Tax=Pedobacter ghigonis TaxID=2730403 RepID=UPI00158D6BF8|nr:efflux RND transporter periplasmic adaptor subunit [Pedobacter ghigonis]
MKNILICLLTLFLFSCQDKQAETSIANYTLQGDTVIVSSKSNLTSKLKTQLIHDEPYRLQMLTAGTVKAIPTQYAEIAPPFSGRVVKSYLRLGMRTTPETPLFEISSPDFMTAQKIFFQAKSQLEQSRKNLERQQDLVAHGVGTQKDLEEAQTSYEVEKKEFENASVGIRIFKADPGRLSIGQPLVVRAPISGEVIENKVVLGQFIKDDASSIATVAELSKIWIAGQVKEKDIRFIHELDECNIEIAALPEQHIKGKVYHVNEIVDEATRSVEVLIEADNKDHTLKPGMYVTVNFVDAPVNAILIPAKAILQTNEASFVFVVVAPGKYIKRKVTVSGTSEDRVVIGTGLQPGERIVSEGSFYLLDAK